MGESPTWEAAIGADFDWGNDGGTTNDSWSGWRKTRLGIMSGSFLGTNYGNQYGAIAINSHVAPYVTASTSFPHSVIFIGKVDTTNGFVDLGYSMIWVTNNFVFDGYGVFSDTVDWQVWDSGSGNTNYIHYSTAWPGSTNVPTWCAEPTTNNLEKYYYDSWQDVFSTARGFGLKEAYGIIEWQFNYCINKYW